MTPGEIVAIAFLLILVALVLWNIRGHRRRSDRDHHDGFHWGDGPGGAD